MPIFGISASSGLETRILGDFYQIQTTLLGSAQSTVTFSAIPSTYSHLQIRISGRGSTNDALYMYVNGVNTGTSYSRHAQRSNGTVDTFNNTGQPYSYVGQIKATASVFASYLIDILDYTNTNKNKTFKFFGSSDNNTNGGGYIEQNSSVYLSATSITSISFFVGSTGGIETGSRFSLYGIKA